ncbi:MAG: ABC transporter substrate-binding protein [Desulfobacterales bacterium]|nr:ABC transporter substrate-binding protein [Desulfobacterales bacterium]
MPKLAKTVIILFLTVLAGVYTGAEAKEKPGNIETLKVAYAPHFGFSPFFIAMEKGYFREEGLDVRLTRFRSGGHMLAPLSTGRLDVAMGRIGTDLFNAFHQGLEIKIVAGGEKFDIVFMARKDLFDSGKVTEPKGLKGRKMPLTSYRGLMEYVYSRVLALGGLTIDHVQLVSLPFHEIPTAFANGAIDAGATAYPMAARILDAKMAVQMPLEKIETIQGSVVYFGKRMLTPAYRDAGVRFLTAYIRAVRDIRGEDWLKDEHLLIYQKYVKFPPALIRRCPPPVFHVNGEIDGENIMAQQAYHVERGYTEFQEPLPLSRMIENGLRKDALDRGIK